MRFILSGIATTLLATRRLWNHRSLMMCLLVGLIVAVGLLSSIPMYSDAINNRLLQGELTEQGTSLPPFAFVWRYIGAWNGDIDDESYRPINAYLSAEVDADIGLPVEMQVRHARTTKLRLFPEEETQSFISDEPLLFTSVGYLTDVEDRISMVEGGFISAESTQPQIIPVIVSEALATEIGLQVGEQYVVFGQGASRARLPVEIVGVWREKNAADPYWFYQPTAYDDVLLTTEAAFNRLVMPALEDPISQAVWYQVYDGARVRTGDVNTLLEGIRSAESSANALLDQTTLDTSPVNALASYGDSARLLTVLLTIFAIPVAGLVLYFVNLIAGMVVRRGQNEIAILRSRGTTRGQIVMVYALEGVLIGILGLAGGLLLGRQLAQLMSRTRTFLSLTDSAETLPILFSQTAIQYAFIAIFLCLLALLIPALISSRYTIVTFKSQRARALQKPLWQRYFLDILLLVPPFYGWYLLNQQGTVSILSQGSDPFSNPLLFLVPALFCFAVSLLFIRVFPRILSGLALLAGRLPGVTVLLTLRQLARAATQYTGPLLLISLTLSLATFTASMALTLDNHLIDQMYYETGADLKLAELGENTEEQEQPQLAGQSAQPTPSPDDSATEPRFLFLPVSDHLKVDGVEQAARVGVYEASSNIGGRQQQGELLGVDRIDFPQVAFFRDDFNSAETLGGLMNRLAANRDNILVSKEFLARRDLTVGDTLRLNVGAAGDFADIEFRVAGDLDLFPTYFPADGVLFVTNLDYVHEGLGGQYPYDVWLKTQPDVAHEDIVMQVRRLGINVVTAEDARTKIADEQTRPERQGVFGLLSVGFMAAAGLTILGFLVYAVVSFQGRFIELGMLRAVGLSVRQMAGYMASEQAVLILTGMGLGTGIGVLASQLFIPFLQVGLGRDAQIPPFIVEIAWEQITFIYVVFAAMFLVAVVVLMILLARMKVFEAVKLGETV